MRCCHYWCRFWNESFFLDHNVFVWAKNSCGEIPTCVWILFQLMWDYEMFLLLCITLVVFELHHYQEQRERERERCSHCWGSSWNNSFVGEYWFCSQLKITFGKYLTKNILKAIPTLSFILYPFLFLSFDNLFSLIHCNKCNCVCCL